MTEKDIYKRAALKKGGWVFEESKYSKYECSWKDIYNYVNNKLHRHDVVLDIGTGEGIKFMGLNSHIMLGIGIDVEAKMISLAKKHQKQKRITRFFFMVMDSKTLAFPDCFFNVVLCRHAPFNLKEVKRVLRPNGFFITQQVHERDKQNIKDLFGRGQCFNDKSDRYSAKIVLEARKLGFREIKTQFSNLDYFFNSKQHMIDFLKITPVIPGFRYSKEKKLVDLFVKDNRTKKGIKSNSARFLIMMKK